MLTRKRNVSNNVIMSENVNKPTERVKMSETKHEFKQGDFIVALDGFKNIITDGKTYQVIRFADDGVVCVVDDRGLEVDLFTERFKLKEENVVTNKGETKQYYEQRTGLVYDLVFQGERLTILKAVLSGSEVVVDIENLENTYHFIPYTKAMQKQAKMREDLSTLTNLTGELRKLLDDNYSICYVKVNREVKGLVEFTVMLGENV